MREKLEDTVKKPPKEIASIRTKLDAEIVAHQRLESELRQAKHEWEDVFNALGQSAMILDEEHKIITANRACAKAVGLALSEVIGKKCFRLFHRTNKAPHECPLDKLFRSRCYEIAEMEMQACGGLFHVSCTPIFNAQGRVEKIIHLATDITESKKREQILGTLTRQLLEVQEKERRSIARELHDEIGQILTAVKTNLYSLQIKLKTATNSAEFVESFELLDNAMRRVRDLSLDLRPSVLDDFGLSEALKWYLGREANRCGLKIHLTMFPSNLQLDTLLATNCFRLVQAALTNVIRHAHAQEVKVSLRRFRTWLQLTIRDDGLGFDVKEVMDKAANGETMGLMGMRERVNHLGGQMEIQSCQGNTEIVFRIPLRLPPVSDDPKPIKISHEELTHIAGGRS